MTVVAPAGTILTIQQVVGKCGDVTFRTEKVLVSHKLKDENSSCKPTDGYNVLVTCQASNSMVIFFNFNPYIGTQHQDKDVRAYVGIIMKPILTQSKFSEISELRKL